MFRLPALLLAACLSFEYFLNDVVGIPATLFARFINQFFIIKMQFSPIEGCLVPAVSIRKAQEQQQGEQEPTLLDL